MKFLLPALASSALALAACSDKPAAKKSTPAKSDATATWLLAAAPENPLTVTQAKADAKEGDAIVLRGRIGGRKEPISTGSAVFTVMDLAIPYCGEQDVDECDTPWDYCCETPETIKANAATVRILGADGKPFAGDPVAAGLEPLDEIIIVGTVGARPSADVLTIAATGIYRIGH